MSDLQKRVMHEINRHIVSLAGAEGTRCHGWIASALNAGWPIIEAELQKRDRLRDQINDAYVRTEDALTEANKLLEQTIEVLEVIDNSLKSGLSECPLCATLNYGGHFGQCEGVKPLLDNLKALKKERTGG